MPSPTEDDEHDRWERLVGTWATEATHPGLPGVLVRGRSTFEWLDDQRVLLQRSHYDHPDIPDALVVTAVVDGNPTMHYFDPRGVHRVFAVELAGAALGWLAVIVCGMLLYPLAGISLWPLLPLGLLERALAGTEVAALLIIGTMAWRRPGSLRTRRERPARTLGAPESAVRATAVGG